MKNFFIALITLALILTMCLVLVSCNGDSEPEDTEPKQTESDTEAPKKEDQNPADDPADTPVVTEYTFKTVSTTDDYGLAGTYTVHESTKAKVGDQIKVVATVNDGYNFEGWYISEVQVSDKLEYTHTMKNQNVTVEARYSYYTVSTYSDTDEFSTVGEYTKLDNKKVSVGEKVTVTATVKEGCNFEGWYINDVRMTQDLEYSFTMKKENVGLEARYSYYTLSTGDRIFTGYYDELEHVEAGTYTEYSEDRVSAGTEITLTATVKDGYNFEGWYIDDICVCEDLEYTFEMGYENVYIEAIYSVFTVSTSAHAEDSHGAWEDTFVAGTYTVLDEKYVSVGDTVTVVATVNDGYNFAGWYIDGVCVCEDLEYTFEMEDENVTLEAVYNYFVLTTTARYKNAGVYSEFDDFSVCMEDVYTETKVSTGTEITLTAKELGGHTFEGWYVDGVCISEDLVVTAEMPAEDVEVYASYIRN